MMRTTASTTGYHNQESFSDLFDEINDILKRGNQGTTPVPVEQYPARSVPSNKTAVEFINESVMDKNQHHQQQQQQQQQQLDYDAQPILLESDESEDDHLDYDHTYQHQSLSTTSSQQRIPPSSQQQCLLLCPITEESPSVCMCYNCKKKKTEEMYLSPSPSPSKNKKSSRSPKQSKRSWTSAATNGFGLGGIADRVKQTFTYGNNNNNKSSSLLSPPSHKPTKRQSQHYKNYARSAYDDDDEEEEEQYERPPSSSSQKRPSSREAKRWIPRPKSLPAISAYIQRRQDDDDDDDEDGDDNEGFANSGYGSRIDQDRPRSWYSKKSSKSRRSSRRSSFYNDNDDYCDNSYDDRSIPEHRNDNYYDGGSSVADQRLKRSSGIIYDGISEKYEMSPNRSIEPITQQQQQQHHMDYYCPQEIQPQQLQQPCPQQTMHDDYNNNDDVVQVNQRYQQLPVEQSYLDQQNYQQFPYQQQQQQQQFLPEPLQIPSMTATPTSLPALTELPFLTPGTRVGEEHQSVKMKEIRTLATKEERMASYNNAYYHCIMARSNLIPWLTKQYSKGPPDAMFDYTPKPKKTPKKLFNMFKLCNTGNNKDSTSSNNNSSSLSASQMPWQPSVSPMGSNYLLSPISPVPSISPNSASILTSSSSIHNQSQIHLSQPQLHAPNACPSNSSLLSPVSQQMMGGSETSTSPSSNNTSTYTPISSVDETSDFAFVGNRMMNGGGQEIISNSSIYQQEEEEMEDEEEPFEPVLPRPRSFCSSSNISINDLKCRPSRSSGISLASTSKSDIFQQRQQPVSILKKSRSSASLQPQSNRFYSDYEEIQDHDNDDMDEDYYDHRPSSSRSSSKKFLKAPTPSSRRQQQQRKGHVKRRSFSQVEEPIYFMDHHRRPHRQPFPRRSSSRGSYYDDDQESYEEPYHHPDDIDEGDEYHMIDDRPLPRRILGRARAHQGFYQGSRLNHLRSSRGPPPLWVAESEPAEFVDDVIEEDPFPRRRRTSVGRLSRPSSRNSIVVYDDVVPAPRASPVYYY